MKKLLFILSLTISSASLTPETCSAQTAPPAKVLLNSVTDASVYSQFVGMIRSSTVGPELAALGVGGYTVFATNNLIFRAISSNKMDSLDTDPAKMAMVLKAHIIKGKLTKADIDKKLTVGKGKTTLTNLLGQPLALSLTTDSKLVVTDVKGNKAFFLVFNMIDPGAVIHGIDNLLMVGR